MLPLAADLGRIANVSRVSREIGKRVGESRRLTSQVLVLNARERGKDATSSESPTLFLPPIGPLERSAVRGGTSTFWVDRR